MLVLQQKAIFKTFRVFYISLNEIYGKLQFI